MNTTDVKQFDKGMALLTAVGFGGGASWWGLSVLIVALISIFCFKKVKLDHMWTYVLLILFMPTIGIPLGYYNLGKKKALNQKMDINTKKDFLFWLAFLLLVALNVLVIAVTVGMVMYEDLQIRLTSGAIVDLKPIFGVKYLVAICLITKIIITEMNKKK